VVIHHILYIGWTRTRIELEKPIWKASLKGILGFNLCFKLLLHLTHSVSMHVYRHCIFQPFTYLFLMHAYYFTLLNPIFAFGFAFDREQRIDMYYLNDSRDFVQIDYVDVKYSTIVSTADTVGLNCYV
jgi:hypothetical protein